MQYCCVCACISCHDALYSCLSLCQCIITGRKSLNTSPITHTYVRTVNFIANSPKFSAVAVHVPVYVTTYVRTYIYKNQPIANCHNNFIIGHYNHSHIKSRYSNNVACVHEYAPLMMITIIHSVLPNKI